MHSITYLLGIIIAIDVSVSLVRVVQFSVLLSRDSMVPLKVREDFRQLPSLLFFSVNDTLATLDNGAGGITPAASMRSVSNMELRHTYGYHH